MLRQRVITAAVLLVLLTAILFFLPNAFFLGFVVLVVALGGWEWANLAGVTEQRIRLGFAAAVAALALVLLLLPWPLALAKLTAVLAVIFWCFAIYRIVTVPSRTSSGNSIDVNLLVSGVFVLLSTALAMITLRFHVTGHSVWLLLYVLALVWVMDIGAYFAGRRFGRTKLAPVVSPGKTREGVYGGLAGALLLILLVLVFSATMREHTGVLLVASIAAALISVVGDLYESRLKRSRGIKDSSQLLPGHGGVLDRIDGVVAALPVFLAFWVWT